MSRNSELAVDFSKFFIEILPAKPYCSYDKKLRFIFPREKALQMKYIQLNHPACARGFAVDLDIAGEAPVFPWEAPEIPPPTFAVWNHENGHSHLIWLLTGPVFARSREGAELRALAEAFRAAIGGDKAIVFQKQLIKNPLHIFWKTLHAGSVYDFAELREAAPALGLRGRKSKEELQAAAMQGRNCALFDVVRKEAYGLVSECYSEEELREKVVGVLRLFNAALARPFTSGDSDLRSLAKSIARWTWAHRGNLKSARARKKAETKDIPGSGRGRYMRVRGMNVRGKLLMAAQRALQNKEKITAAGIARTAGVRRETAQKYIREIRAATEGKSVSHKERI